MFLYCPERCHPSFFTYFTDYVIHVSLIVLRVLLPIIEFSLIVGSFGYLVIIQATDWAGLANLKIDMNCSELDLIPIDTPSRAYYLNMALGLGPDGSPGFVLM